MASSSPPTPPTQPPPATSPAPDTHFHQILLVLAAGIVGLSCLLQVTGERTVSLPVIGIPLPGTCTYQRWFGIDCPGCGLTRSFVSLGHGDLSSAWRFNPAGPLGFLMVASQIPYRAAQLWRVRRGRPELRWGKYGLLLFWTFVASLFIQWGVRLGA